MKGNFGISPVTTRGFFAIQRVQIVVSKSLPIVERVKEAKVENNSWKTSRMGGGGTGISAFYDFRRTTCLFVNCATGKMSVTELPVITIKSMNCLQLFGG